MFAKICAIQQRIFKLDSAYIGVRCQAKRQTQLQKNRILWNQSFQQLQIFAVF